MSWGSLQGYVEYWGVLLRCSLSSPNRIALYENTELARSQHPHLVIGLDHVLCVKPIEMKEKAKMRRYQFQVLALNTKHQFAAKGAEECRTWVKKLNRQLFGPPEDGVLCKIIIGVYVNIVLQNDCALLERNMFSVSKVIVWCKKACVYSCDEFGA